MLSEKFRTIPGEGLFACNGSRREADPNEETIPAEDPGK